jgi:hypothetical protein
MVEKDYDKRHVIGLAYNDDEASVNWVIDEVRRNDEHNEIVNDLKEGDYTEDHLNYQPADLEGNIARTEPVASGMPGDKFMLYPTVPDVNPPLVTL